MLRAVKDPATRLESDLEGVRSLDGFEYAENTTKAYESDWSLFTRYLAASNLTPVPGHPDHVSAYLFHLYERGKAKATIERAFEALKSLYDEVPETANPCHNKTVKKTLSAIRRKLKGQKKGAALPARLNDVHQVLLHCDASILGLRDAALISLGFTCALRLEDYTHLTLGDLDMESEPDGAWLHIPFSKTDQEGEGSIVWIPKDEPLGTLSRLSSYITQLPEREPTTPLFWASGPSKQLVRPVTHRGASHIINKAFSRAKLPQFTSHSLRAGFATEAAAAGATAKEIQLITRHACPTTLYKYVRLLSARENHPSRLFTKSVQYENVMQGMRGFDTKG